MNTRSMFRHGLLLNALLASTLVLPTAARSQEEPRVTPLVGKKVRLLAPAAVSGRIEGVVLEMDQHSLLIRQAENTRLKVPRPAVTQLEVSKGRQRHTLKGMWIGASAFLLLGFASNLDNAEAKEMGLAALAGSMWGAAIGSLIEGERWSAVPLDRVALVRTQGPAPRLSVTIRF